MPDGITKEEIYDNLYVYLSEELADMSDDINDLEQASFLRALNEMLDYQRGKKQPNTLQNDDARMVFNLVIPKLTGDESFRIAPNLPYGSEQLDKAFEKVYGYAKEKHERRAEKEWERKMRLGDYGKIAKEYAELVRNEIVARGGDEESAKLDSYAIENAVRTLVHNFQDGNLKNWDVIDDNYEAYAKIAKVSDDNNLSLGLDEEYHQIRRDEILDILRRMRDLPQKRLADKKIENEIRNQLHSEPQPEVKVEAKSEPQPEVKVNAEETFQEKLRNVSPRQFAKDYAELVKNEIIARGGNENSAELDAFTVENAVYTLVYNFQKDNLKRFDTIDENYEALKKLDKLSRDNKLDLKFPSNYRQPKGTDISDVMKQIGDLPNMRPVAKEAEAKAEPLGMTPDIRARYIRTTLTGLVAFNNPNMDPTQMAKLANTFANLSDYAMEQPSARADFVDKGLETLFERYPDQAEALKTICTADDLNLSQQERVREVLRICYMNEMNELSPANFDKLSEFNPFTATQVPGVSKPAHKQEEKQAQKHAQANPMSL